MANLETRFLGLKLKSPIIVSSSGLTDSVEKIKKIEKYGAGAVILKSLFEEQIDYESGYVLDSGLADYPEAVDYIKNYVKNNSLNDYLSLIEGAKKDCKIPVIASINCVTSHDWTDFAIKIQNSGADAIELNINIIPTDTDKNAADTEKIYLEIFEKVKSKISIPVIIKIGPNFSNILHFINQLKFRGLRAVTLFNKFYEPDINVFELKHVSTEIFSASSDLKHVLRWIGLVSGKIESLEIAGSTGIHDGKSAVKMLLAGADVTQVCSVLYKNGPEYIQKLNQEITEWMEKSNFKNISEFKGKLNYKNIKNPSVYERSQFMKHFSSLH